MRTFAILALVCLGAQAAVANTCTVDCWGDTAGKCQNQYNRVCYPLESNGECAAGTTACDSNGATPVLTAPPSPVPTENDVVVLPPSPSAAPVPAPTFDVSGYYQCLYCFSNSSGPCRANNSDACHPADPSTGNCWPGSYRCSATDPAPTPQPTATPKPTVAVVYYPCTSCYGDSSGPCQAVNSNACWPLDSTTGACTYGTVACDSTGSKPPLKSCTANLCSGPGACMKKNRAYTSCMPANADRTCPNTYKLCYA